MWACFHVRARAWQTVYKLSKHGCLEMFPFRVSRNTSLAFRDHDGSRSCILYFIMCTSTTPWSDQPEGKLGLGLGFGMGMMRRATRAFALAWCVREGIEGCSGRTLSNFMESQACLAPAKVPPQSHVCSAPARVVLFMCASLLQRSYAARLHPESLFLLRSQHSTSERVGNLKLRAINECTSGVL